MTRFGTDPCCTRTLLVVLLALCAGGSAIAQDVQRFYHPWGRFEPGAWKKVRVITENFDAERHVVTRNITETKTELLRVTETGVVLRIKASHELAGKRFESEPQIIEQRFNGSLEGQKASFQLSGTGSVKVDGETIECCIQQLEVTTENHKTISRTYFSEDVAPFLLRTESKTTPIDGEQVTHSSVVEVIALEMPQQVCGDIKSTSHLKFEERAPGGVSKTLLVTALDVPGEVVSHTSKHMDTSGEVVRRSTLELLEYEGELAPLPRREGVLRRLLFRRFRRAPF